MKCNHCEFENKETAKFCSRCGKPLNIKKTESNNNSKIIIISLIIVILILVVTTGYLMLNNNHSLDSSVNQPNYNQNNESVSDDENSAQTTQVQSTQTNTESKEWELIGSYSGSGSGSQSISVPAGEIMIKLSAYPIKNYASNYLYVTGSNGESAGVDWGSTSAVETRSNSLSYSSSSPQTFNIEYYETVSWQVDFYRYQ